MSTHLVKHASNSVPPMVTFRAPICGVVYGGAKNINLKNIARKRKMVLFCIVILSCKILEFDWLRNIWQKILLPHRVPTLHPPSNNSWQLLTILKIVNCAGSIVGRHVCTSFDKKEYTLTKKL
jgi:hypothetical protein